MLSNAAWSRASSVELSTCSTLRILLLRPRLWGCSDRPGSLMLGGVRPDMVGWVRSGTRDQVAANLRCERSGGAPSCHAPSLVYSPTRWPFKSRCIKVLVSRARTIAAHIPKGCSPLCRAARDSLVSPIPSPLSLVSRVSSSSEGWLFARTLTITCRTLCVEILTRVCASRGHCCILSCHFH